MPRVSVCLNRHDPDGRYENENIDFCVRCFKKLDVFSVRKAGNISQEVNDDEIKSDIAAAKNGDEGSEHPPYDECDYKCAHCGRLLTEKDD